MYTTMTLAQLAEAGKIAEKEMKFADPDENTSQMIAGPEA